MQTQASITRLVNHLDELGAFFHTQRDAEMYRVGAPPWQLSIRAEEFFAIGIEAGYELVISLVDLSGRVLGEERVESLPMLDPDAKFLRRNAEEAFAAIERLKLANDVPEERFAGVGCSHDRHFQGIFGIDFHQRQAHADYTKVFGYPIPVLATGPSMALAEHVFGGASGLRGTVYVLDLGARIAGGALIEGRLARGFRNQADFPKALIPNHHNQPTLQSLAEVFSRLKLQSVDRPTLEELNATGNPEFVAWQLKAGNQLELIVDVVRGFYDPSVIIVGGELLALLDSMQFAERALRLCYPSALSNSSGRKQALGAAAIPFYRALFPGGAEWHSEPDPDHGTFLSYTSTNDFESAS